MQLIHSDCLEVLKGLEDNSVDSIVTDPPYGLSFMGKKWDYDVPSEDIWRECLRVLKPGGHLLAFAGTRTQHRMAVRIEDAGFEIRDMIAWVYGSGFPKSLNIGKAVDKLQGNEREVVGEIRAGKTAMGQNSGWNAHENKTVMEATKGTSPHEGWGTALKPALEPITVARKPLIGTVAQNVLTYGTGGINIDACRVEANDKAVFPTGIVSDTEAVFGNGEGRYANRPRTSDTNPSGRFPANLIHDGSPEVLSLFPETKGAIRKPTGKTILDPETGWNANSMVDKTVRGFADQGSAARFFYCAKASKKDRDEGCEDLEARSAGEVTGGREEGSAGLNSPRAGAGRTSGSKNFHPTVKPTELMRYLCRLVTPPGGTVLDPFMGSGSTGKAARLEGFDFIGIEREAEYVEIAKARIQP
jgi:site-specific DNA-methyltransferase (adenine-specific)